MPVELSQFESAPGYTFFHSRRWQEALLGAFPHWRDAARTITLPDGRAALLPLLQTGRAGLWRWLEAMPYAFFGGPLVREGDIDGAALESIADAVWPGTGWLALNLDPVDSLAAPGVITRHAAPLTTHLLRLEGGFEAVQGRFSKTMRYDMRRAARDGVMARRGAGRADFAAYYALTQNAARRWGLPGPPYPAALYDALAVLPADRVSLWLAEYEGGIIGGLINIYYAPGRVLHWASALDSDSMRLNPTKLLQREAIAEACARGAALYNLGPSAGFDGQPLNGVRQAKEALGAAAHDYTILIRMRPWAMRLRAAQTRIRRTWQKGTP